MKQKIRLTEADLHRVIKETVKAVINEAYKGGMSYAKAKGAYDKMRSLGQYDRAKQLETNYNTVNADDDFEYNFAGDTAYVTKPSINKKVDIAAQEKLDGSREMDYDSWQHLNGMRYDNAKDAVRMSNHFGNFMNQKYNKNMFRK